MKYPPLANRAWRVVKSENILRLGPWLSVRQECVELPSGVQIPTWFILEFPDWINVIAVTKDGQMVRWVQAQRGYRRRQNEPRAPQGSFA